MPAILKEKEVSFDFGEDKKSKSSPVDDSHQARCNTRDDRRNTAAQSGKGRSDLFNGEQVQVSERRTALESKKSSLQLSRLIPLFKFVTQGCSSEKSVATRGTRNSGLISTA
jgi:hypothetical protein